ASGYASPAVNGRRIPGLGAISHLVGGAVGMPDIADIDGVIALPIRFVLIPEIPRSVYEYGVRIAVCEIVHDQELRMGGGVRRSSSPGIGQAYGLDAVIDYVIHVIIGFVVEAYTVVQIGAGRRG